MSEEVVTYNRRKLYEEVWSEPITHLAKKYGLSDVGLAKICKKLQIPRPPRGYWAKKAAGKKVKVKPLPPAEREEVAVYRRVNPPPPDEKQQGDVDDKVAFEKRPENRVVVTDVLQDPHELVQQAMDQLTSSADEDDPLLSKEGPGGLDIRVSRGSLDRALRIMDALIKALSGRGYVVASSADDEPVSIEVLGESLPFSLVEQIDRVERTLTRSELKERQKYPWRYGDPEYEEVPSGRLTLQVHTDMARGLQKAWSDTEKSRLEDRLNSFIAGLIRIAVRQKAERLEAERRNREWEEAQRRRREQWQREREEERKLAQLNKEVDAWHHAQRIRAYVDAVRQAAERKHGEIESRSELDRWLQWANEQADRHDPVV